MQCGEICVAAFGEKDVDFWVCGLKANCVEYMGLQGSSQLHLGFSLNLVGRFSGWLKLVILVFGGMQGPRPTIPDNCRIWDLPDLLVIPIHP